MGKNTMAQVKRGGRRRLTRLARCTSQAFLVSATIALAAPGISGAADVTRTSFGRLSGGTEIEAITLKNAHGVSATVLTYGATLQALVAPDRTGAKADVVLGFRDAEAYERNNTYMGGSIGRYANRIGLGRFTLDGKAYQLALNDNGVAALHGGAKGFDKRIWAVVDIKQGPVASVTLALISPDGEEGYPGALKATAVYSLDETDRLTIRYSAVTDRPTIVNLTNHALFNMAGEGAEEGAMGNILQIVADGYTPVDAQLIPTGRITPLAGTAFDFREPREIAVRLRDAADPQVVVGRGFDHNYVLRGAAGAAPRLVARLSDPKSGRSMEILSDQPGLQFYSGNFLNGVLVGKTGRLYRQGDGIALEPQRFPDAPNKPQFASARLDPGQTYSNTMIFHLMVDPAH
jgi:aldose 1-epimerase